MGEGHPVRIERRRITNDYICIERKEQRLAGSSHKWTATVTKISETVTSLELYVAFASNGGIMSLLNRRRFATVDMRDSCEQTITNIIHY